MTETIHPLASTAIRRALEGRIPKPVLMSGTPQKTVLRQQRVAKSSATTIARMTSTRWITASISACKSDNLADILAPRLQAANATEQSTVGMDAAWQSYQWAEAKRAQARRADGKSEAAYGWRRGL